MLSEQNSSIALAAYAVVGVLLLFVLDGQALHTEEGLEVPFRERTHRDSAELWHRESHKRCRSKLVRHLYWACKKDIHRLKRRNHKRTDFDEAEATSTADGRQAMQKNSDKSQSRPIWLLSRNHAKALLRTRRSDTPSITNECCIRKGCTWEEYAEYCPSNKRRNHF